MRTIAIVNQKGGCGKTTTAINLAGVFAGGGHRTLLVDMDPQSHCAAGLAIPENRIDLHIGDAMLAGVDAPVDPNRLLWRVSRNLDLAPSTLRLAALEAPRGELAGKADAERRLSQVLKRFDSQYDVCLIDCSPAIGLLAFNALVAADEVLIPVETGFFSLQGATKQVSTIKSIGKRLGVAPVHRILATMHEPASALSRDLLEELRKRFVGRVIPVVIRFDQALREAASFGQPVVEYSTDSPGAQDYRDLAEWLVINSLSRGAAERVIDEAMEPSASGTGAVITASPRATAVGAMTSPPPPHAQATNGSAGEAETPSVQLGRAADMVQRARRLHAKATELAGDGTGNAAPGAASQVEIKAIAEPAAGPGREAGAEPTISEPERRPAATESRSAASMWPTAAFGPQVTPHGVIFRAPASIGRSVAVAGDFNQWLPERTPMRLSETTGTLEAVAFMPPGSTSQYRLVIDGNWIADPYNPSVVPNPFGGTNSIVSVPVMPPEVIVSAGGGLGRGVESRSNR